MPAKAPITPNIEELTQVFQKNRRTLQHCIELVKQLPPSQQEAYNSLLKEIKAQMRMTDVETLQKIQSVLGGKKHSGPALSDHVQMCFQQNQLISNTLHHTTALIEQAYRKSSYDAGNRSRIIQQNMIQTALDNMADTNNTGNTGNAPQAAPTPQPTSAPRPVNASTPRKNIHQMRSQLQQQAPSQPQMPSQQRMQQMPAQLVNPVTMKYTPAAIMLAKMIQRKKDNIKQLNTKEEFLENKEETSDLSMQRSLNNKSLGNQKRVNLDKILHNKISMNANDDRYLENVIHNRSQECRRDFRACQKDIMAKMNMLENTPEPAAPQLSSPKSP